MKEKTGKLSDNMRQPLKAYFRPLYFPIRKLLAGQLSFMELAYFRAVYFSQFGEDAYLDYYFSGRNSGFYVDVGAFHPFNISNTCVFYKRGWRGINIEPNPASFRAFPKHRPRDINLNFAVSRYDTEVSFNCSEELSGIDGDADWSRDSRRTADYCRVRSMPLSEILNKNLPKDKTIDFMSIDCEGHDAEVLHSNDWDQYRPRIILVEDEEEGASAIDGIMDSVGYRFDRKLGLTKVFVEPDAIAESDYQRHNARNRSMIRAATGRKASPRSGVDSRVDALSHSDSEI